MNNIKTVTFAGLCSVLFAAFLPNVHAAAPPIYACYFAHVEEYRNVQSRESYLKGRKNIRLFAEMMAKNGAAFNFQVDWTFLSEVGLYDSGPVLRDTNGKNLIRYFSEDLGTAIDPHAHENFGYNYADVAYMIEQLGVPPSPVVGGFLYSPADNKQEWERFLKPLPGAAYPDYTWTASILFVGSVAGHQGNDDLSSGCWRMDNKYFFYRHNPGSSLIHVGDGGRDYESLLELLAYQEAGMLDEGKMYTAAICITEIPLKSPSHRLEVEAQVGVLNRYAAEGRLIWATVEEMARIWQDEYGGEPNIYRHRYFPVIQSGDYNGDGTTDIALFRKSTGLWAIREVTRAYFETENDLPVSGDYDGDGTTDIAVFQGDSGLWHVRAVTRFYFGVDSDQPVPADYDGDGTCDPGVYREGYGLWAIRDVTRTYFGGYSDKLVPGDYNGDGSCDLAIFRPFSGLWAVRNLTRFYFGAAADWLGSDVTGDDPLPADFNGDGTVEATIFRPQTGLWAARGVSRFYFGTTADSPVRGNFKERGHDSLGIFRASSGLWAVRGVTQIYFGGSGDLPVVKSGNQ